MSKSAKIERKTNKDVKRRRLRLGWALPAAGGLIAMGATVPAAHAFQLYDGQQYGNNLIVNLDITTTYGGIYQVGGTSKLFMDPVHNANGNDAAQNFAHNGLVSNQFEALPVLDIKDGTFGMHFSGEYFLNTIYMQHNQNSSPGTLNAITATPQSFNSAVRQSNGSNGRMLDAFVYDSWNFGQGEEASLKAGKQTLFWGQKSFSSDGISGGQAPVDVVAAEQLVAPQLQQLFLPVGQVVATYKPQNNLTLQGYYQFEWAPDSFNGSGSYFGSDVIGPGSSRLVAVNGTTDTNGFYFYQSKPLTPPSQNGQFGLSAQGSFGNYDVGLFGLRYDSKTPTVYTTEGPFDLTRSTGASIGSYQVVYPRDIWIYGASLSTTVGATNLAGELSTHRHLNLVGSAPLAVFPASPGNANSNPGYPVGNTVTALVNGIYGSPGIPFDPGGVTVTAEMAYVGLLSTTENKAALAPGRSSSAAEFEVTVTPAYFDVIPNLEITFPTTLQYNFAGNSEVDSTMNHGTGSISFQVSATYRSAYTASLAYVNPFGSLSVNANTPNRTQDYQHFVNLSLSHTF